MVRCRGCDAEVDDGDGLLSVVGLASAEGYACSGCGTVFCGECMQERKRTGAHTYDECPVCDDRLERR